MTFFRLDPRIAGGSGPSVRELDALAHQGFRSILNLSAEGEADEHLSPNVEATWAHTLEMRHARLSIYPDNLRSTHVERFLRLLDDLPAPIYVESTHARRAAAFLTIRLALERHLDADQALAAARELGMDCECEQLLRFVRAEIGLRVPGAPAPSALERAELEAVDPLIPGTLPRVQDALADTRRP